jgi:hypothetical protein
VPSLEEKCAVYSHEEFMAWWARREAQGNRHVQKPMEHGMNGIEESRVRQAKREARGCETRKEMNARYRAVYAEHGFKGVIDEACGSNHGDEVYLWELAMTARYGPVGIHESYYGPDGCLTTEALERFPVIAERVGEAIAKFRRMLSLD